MAGRESQPPAISFAPSSLFPATVGFLDDLKQQADAARAQQSSDHAALARNTALVEAACLAAFRYFTSLAAQLEVLKPAAAGRYLLDRRQTVDGLALRDFKVDARRNALHGAELHDHVVLHWRLAPLSSQQQLEFVRDFPPEIERLEGRIRQSGAEVDAEAIRHADSGRLKEMRYRLAADFRAGVLVVPEHARGRVRFQLDNLDAFETVFVEFPAFEIGSARLDELARWLVGQPHAFLDGGLELRRVEP